MITNEVERPVELRRDVSVLSFVATPPWTDHPYQLISWWDMERFSAEKFVAIAVLIGKWQVKYQSPRLNTEYPLVQADYLIADDEQQQLASDFGLFVKHCLAIGLKIAAKNAQRLEESLRSGSIENRWLAFELRKVREIIMDEMQENLFLYIPSDRAKWYLNPLDGWGEVSQVFPNTVDDVREANICLACGLYAGAVFHATLVLEAGAVELGKLLKINDPKPGWNSVTREIARIIKADHKTLPTVEQQHFKLVEQLHPLIESMKSSWRHKVTHVDNKLVLLSGRFNDRTAEEILIAARSFMRRLADELQKA